MEAVPDEPSCDFRSTDVTIKIHINDLCPWEMRQADDENRHGIEQIRTGKTRTDLGAREQDLDAIRGSPHGLASLEMPLKGITDERTSFTQKTC